jgi:hypothetical protein
MTIFPTYASLNPSMYTSYDVYIWVHSAINFLKMGDHCFMCVRMVGWHKGRYIITYLHLLSTTLCDLLLNSDGGNVFKRKIENTLIFIIKVFLS